MVRLSGVAADGADNGQASGRRADGGHRCGHPSRALKPGCWWTYYRPVDDPSGEPMLPPVFMYGWDDLDG